jgi:hypothetical protein
MAVKRPWRGVLAAVRESRFVLNNIPRSCCFFGIWTPGVGSSDAPATSGARTLARLSVAVRAIRCNAVES